MLEKVEAYLEKNYKERTFRIGDLKKFGRVQIISSEFKKKHNKTLCEYVIKKRVEEAQKMIRAGVALSKIPQQLGWGTTANYNRQFKKITGVNPSTFRKKKL